VLGNVHEDQEDAEGEGGPEGAQARGEVGGVEFVVF